MMKNEDFDNELSMDKIEDYNGKESKEKKNIVRAVIIFCVLMAAFFAYLKTSSVPDDYVGTQSKPGINTSK